MNSFTGVANKVSKLVYNVPFFLDRLLAAVLLKNGVYYMYVHLPVYTEDMIRSPFHAAHINE